jgi:hypothetical protein
MTSVTDRPVAPSRRFERYRAAAALHPHAALLISVVAAIATEPLLEAGRDSSTAAGAASAAALLVLRALISGACLFVAWEGQRRLRLDRVLACAALLGLGWIAVHELTEYAADKDLQIYATTGSTLLDGSYPGSEYPTGAVVLFGVEVLVGGDYPRTFHAVLMVAFHLATVAAIWSLRTRWSPWLAAFVAVWPMNAFHWELRYDLAPTALLVVGLALAYRTRWTLSGIALGVGAALKWVPGLALAALAVWLFIRGPRRSGLALVGGFLASLAVLTLPFLLWDSDHVLDAYRRQGDRGIMGESLWYLPLRAVGVASSTSEFLSVDVGVSKGLDTAATVVQAAIVVGLILIVPRLHTRSHAVAFAALVPAAFLLTNRVFSAQFLVFLVALWALAAALVVDSAHEQLAVGAAAAIASTANAAVFPYTVWFAWELASALLFVFAIGLTGWLVVRAARRCPEEAPP